MVFTERQNSPRKSIEGLTATVSKNFHISDDAIKNAKSHIDWNSIKYAPQKLKQKAKLESRTIDEEFEDLESNLYSTEQSLKYLLKYVESYKDQIFSNLTIARSISNTAENLFDPYLTLPQRVKNELSESFKATSGSNPNFKNDISLTTAEKGAFTEEYKIWENLKIYDQTTNEILPAIEIELNLLKEVVEKRVSEVLALVSVIKTHIKKRSHALLDYDKVYNSHDALMMKMKQGDLSVKEAQHFYSLDRKLDDTKKDYDIMNDTLKKELPYFFILVESFISPLQKMIYYVQLMASYQFNINLASLKEYYDFTDESIVSPNFRQNLIEGYLVKNKPASECIEQMFITNFRKQFFDNLTKSETKSFPSSITIKSSEFCVAEFHFKGEQEGDLPLKAGNVIKIIECSNEWWKGECNGKVGIFPGSYVKKITPTQ